MGETREGATTMKTFEAGDKVRYAHPDLTAYGGTFVRYDYDGPGDCVVAWADGVELREVAETLQRDSIRAGLVALGVVQPWSEEE